METPNKTIDTRNSLLAITPTPREALDYASQVIEPITDDEERLAALHCLNSFMQPYMGKVVAIKSPGAYHASPIGAKYMVDENPDIATEARFEGFIDASLKNPTTNIVEQRICASVSTGEKVHYNSNLGVPTSYEKRILFPARTITDFSSLEAMYLSFREIGSEHNSAHSTVESLQKIRAIISTVQQLGTACLSLEQLQNIEEWDCNPTDKSLMNLRYCELVVDTPYCILQSDDESGSVIQEDLQAVSFGGFYLGVVTKLTYKKSKGLEERRYVAFEVFASYSHPEKLKEERFSQIALIPAHPFVPILIDLPKTISSIDF